MRSTRFFGLLVLLGFGSGLPLSLVGSTLQAWLTEANINVVAIGWFSLVGLPYTFKFLWAMFLDQYQPLRMGKFRGWVLLTQLAMILGFCLLSRLAPATDLPLMAMVAFGIAFFSATQDIALDAYRTDFLKPRERGLGSAAFLIGYRVALLCAGGLALILAERIGWARVYLLMALFMLIGTFGNYLAPKLSSLESPGKNALATLGTALKEFMKRPYVGFILGFVIFYKFGNAYVLSLLSTFFLRDMHFSLTEVGAAYKIYGLLATIVGLVLGGYWLQRKPLWFCLWWFGLLQALTNALFFLLVFFGKNDIILVFSVVVEQLTSGMGTAAFLACLMTLCHQRFTAIQFAGLSAIDSLGRVFIGPVAGVTVQCVGWGGYFTASILLSIPGLWLLLYLKNKLNFDAEKIGAVSQ